jgi:hypothetical protein
MGASSIFYQPFDGRMLFEPFLLVRQAFCIICELLAHARVGGHGTNMPQWHLLFGRQARYSSCITGYGIGFELDDELLRDCAIASNVTACLRIFMVPPVCDVWLRR